MGKTSGGALWLDAEKTSPYEFYQYWRNVDDADVEECLALLTFLQMDEVHRLGTLEDSQINEAKTVLAYEITKIVHGKTAADNARQVAAVMFSSSDRNLSNNNFSNDSVNIPIITVTANQKLIGVLAENKVFDSKSEGRRLVKQNGLSLNDVKITDADYILSDNDFKDGKAIVRKGKKKYYKLTK